MNIGTFPVLDGGADLGRAGVAVPRSVSASHRRRQDHVTVGFRPESLDVVPAGTPAASRSS